MSRVLMPSPMPAARARLLTRLPGYDPLATAGRALFFPTLEEAQRYVAQEGMREARGVHLFIEELAKRALEFFPSCIQHVKGELAGTPFILADWQAAIVANIFGWLRPDLTRRYREILLFVPRRNGKTALAAGIVLYVLFCDGEKGSECYSAAADKDQAALVFAHVKGMVLQEPEFQSRSQIYETYKSVVVGTTGNVYRVISAEANTKHGFNSHLVIVDELHAQPNAELVDVLLTSTGSRRQPIVLNMSTSDWDRPSVCNEKHDYASKVRDGVIEDPAFLPIIYEAKPDADWENPAV